MSLIPSVLGAAFAFGHDADRTLEIARFETTDIRYNISLENDETPTVIARHTTVFVWLRKPNTNGVYVAGTTT